MFVVKSVKNISIMCIKIFLVICLCFFVLSLGYHFYDNLKEDYYNYLYVRGFDNYGVETEVILKDNVYIYTVDGVEYLYQNEDNSAVSIDKTIKIYYDILEPSEYILSHELDDIDSFYSNTLHNLMWVYLKLVIGVFVFGFCWYILDRVKYNYLIWKKSV